jgi:hypothetical protein
MKEETILKRLNEDVKSNGFLTVSEKTGVGYGTIWNIVSNQEIKTKRVFKILEKHYKN